MAYDPRQSRYLGGEEPDPEGTPESSLLPDSIAILGSGGIRVYQDSEGERTVVSLDDDLQERIAQALPSAAASDPLSGMAFRAVWQDGTVVVRKGYISYTRWDTDWIHDQFTINEETLTIPGTYPFGVYLAVPMKTVITDLDDNTGPYGYYNASGADTATIEGNPYVFKAEYGTNYTALDDTPPGSYYLAQDTPPTPSAGFFTCLIANVPSEGVVKQVEFGDVTLPQQFWPNLVSITVTP